MMCENYPCCGHEDYECAEYNEDDWDDDEDELSPDASDFIAEEDVCKICAPFACDDPDAHLGVPSEHTPLRNQVCHCGADLDGRDRLCFD